MRELRLLADAPWVRPLGGLEMKVSTEGWRFPAPPAELGPPPPPKPAPEPKAEEAPPPVPLPELPDRPAPRKPRVRPRPTGDMVLFKDRLLYLLQPPLDNLFSGKQVSVPFQPFQYQLEGIAFLMPRHAALLADEMGLGKAQPLDAKVLTPQGWKRMGDIRVGDEVIGSDGQPTRVTAVYPQGEKEIFRVEFSDGSSTECCDDHLWEVNTALRRWRKRPGRVLPLREIRTRLTFPSGNHVHFIPMVAPAAFPKQQLPIDPYLLGALLGDGGLSTHRIRFSTTDPEMIERLSSMLPEGVRFVRARGSQCDWRVSGPGPHLPNALLDRLRRLGLMGTKSESKFIPDQYLWSSPDDRLAVLQGLLDTDGSVRSDNNIEYCTVSPRLAAAVQFLVQSLGGTARVGTKQTSRQLAYRMSVILPPEIQPFRLSRKATAYHPRPKYPPRRAIVAVTPVGRKLAQCISVEAPDGLYVTDDFIVTHNTAQAILSIRLMFQAGMIRRALLVAPKPLVFNWSRELALWAPDLPFEVFAGDTQARRAMWTVSNCPLKLINYEVLTRDADVLSDERVFFDLVVLDEAQRIKNRESKTSQVVRSIRRERSWALTGTPIENRPEDLVNIFAFVDPGRIPPETPSKRLPQLTADCILRRTKEDAQSDMPPKVVRDVCLDLTPAQREAYSLAENEGVIRLNALGETITVQHVFQLVMRLKQICNFDPLTGQSAKLEQLLADMQEVADCGRKAIVFSQWVEPLEVLAKALEPFGPLQFHGKIPSSERPRILDRFKNDPDCHVILMSYGTGSVGLNLQFTNYVFLFDRWWNPAVEDQAINRAHRIGQKYPVTVTRFIAEGTIEKRIAEVLEAKRAIFNELLEQNGPPTQLGLTEEEIFGLFDIKSRPKRAA